jgi:mRNA interferase MazF
MASPAVGAVVLVRFPFSDLTQSKLRPAVVLADVGREDYILCQITSNPYADPNAIELRDEHFSQGSLLRASYARPGKLFTANDSLVVREVGALKVEVRRTIVDAIEKLLRNEAF